MSEHLKAYCTAINKIGFPCFAFIAAAALIWALLSMHETAIRENTRALNANTIAMSKVLASWEQFQKDVTAAHITMEQDIRDIKTRLLYNKQSSKLNRSIYPWNYIVSCPSVEQTSN